MSHRREVLSAYLDGEVTPETARKVEARLRNDESYQREYAAYKRLAGSLHADVEPDYAAAAERLRLRIESGVAKARAPRTSIWRRRLSVPLPAAVAAAALFFVVAAGAVYFAAAAADGSPEPLAGVDPRELDITIQIDDGQAQELIRWLEGRKDVQQVNIQLPETPNFELIGDPVLVPASDARGLSR